MKKLIVACLMLLTTACATKTTQFSVIVPEGERFTVSEINQATIKRNITGEDAAGILFVIPLGFPKFQTALESALKQGRGNVMTNAVVTDEVHWYILFGYNKVTVTGDVVNTHK